MSDLESLESRLGGIEGSLVTLEERLSERIAGLGLWLQPIGTIVAYAAEKPPAGWLLCDGAKVSQSAYPELYQILREAYGLAGEGRFCLPDYRGMFLRGVDGGRGVDPDASTRSAHSASGGNSSGRVGSMQATATGPHEHTASLPTPASDGGSDPARTVAPAVIARVTTLPVTTEMVGAVNKGIGWRKLSQRSRYRWRWR